MKTFLITVHGINTEGLWQEMVKPVFAPHFEYKAIKYPYYRRLGVLKLVIEPWVFFPLVIIVFVLWYLSYISSLLMFVLALPILLFSYLGSFVRRRLAVNSVKREMMKYMVNGRRPHIIAHSLGTFLTFTYLGKFPDPRARNIVLTGCVLTRDFDWNRLKSFNPLAFRKIRNEVGSKDWVASLAYYLERWVPGLGVAGFAGFSEAENIVHTVPSPNQPCETCKGQAVPIHNVISPYCGHSDTFIDHGYASRYWLPFLWDIDPTEYEEFLNLCIGADKLEDLGNLSDLRIAEDELRVSAWTWAKGSLEAYVEREINADPRTRLQHLPVADLVSQAISGVWRAVAIASEVSLTQTLGWEKKARALHPSIAVQHAVNSLYR